MPFYVKQRTIDVELSILSESKRYLFDFLASVIFNVFIFKPRTEVVTTKCSQDGRHPVYKYMFTNTVSCTSPNKHSCKGRVKHCT